LKLVILNIIKGGIILGKMIIMEINEWYLVNEINMNGIIFLIEKKLQLLFNLYIKKL